MIWDLRRNRFSLFLFMSLFFLIPLINGFEVTYKDLRSDQFKGITYYCSPNEESCTELGSEVIPEYGPTEIHTHNYNPSDSSSVWKNFYFYQNDRRTISSILDAYGSGSRTIGFEDTTPTYLTPEYVRSLPDGDFTATRDGTTVVTISPSDFDDKDLQGNNCRVTNIQDMGSYYEVYSSLNPLTKITTNNTYAVPEELLEDYYYMKAIAFVEAETPTGDSLIFAPEGDDIDKNYVYNLNAFNSIDGEKTSHQLAYSGKSILEKVTTNDKLKTSDGRYHTMLLKPGGESLSFPFDDIENELETLCEADSRYCGRNQLKIHVVPVDGKCDLNMDGRLDNSEYNSYERDIEDFTTYDVVLGNDEDEFKNFNLAEKLEEKYGSTLPVKEYSVKIVGSDTKIGSTGTSPEDFAFTTGDLPTGSSVYIHNDGSIIGKGGKGGRGYYEASGGSGMRGGNALEITVPTTIDNADGRILAGGGGGGAGGSDALCEEFNYLGNCMNWLWAPGGSGGGGAGFEGGQGGREVDVDDDRGEDGEEGEGGEYTGPGEGGEGDDTYNSGDGGEGGDFGEAGQSGEPGDPTDGPTVSYSGGEGGEPGYAIVTYGNPLSWDGGSVNLRGDINTTNQYQFSDTIRSLNTVGLNRMNGKIFYFDEDGIRTEIPVPPTINTKNIKIYKNDILVEERDVDPKRLALQAHKLQKARNKQEVEQFVDDTYRLMNEFEIIKNLSYDDTANRTRVQIKLQDIPASERQNITIYQVVPKSIASDVSELNFVSDGGGKRFVMDKDPVIGWHFNDSGDSSSVEYETEGETEGGDIIVTQEPILYNEGELIVNYRQDGCNPDEAALFEVDSLEDSGVYPTGTGEVFTVCVAHLNESLREGTDFDLSQHVFNTSTGGNISLLDAFNQDSIDITVDNSTSIYWDMKVARNNPSGNYSCLGSIDNKNNSRFGDCGWTMDRIWLHLGADYEPPNTTLDYPYLAHTVRVELNATDNIGGSGVANTYYCVTDQGSSCSPTKSYSGAFTITCPNDWGCVKRVRYYSEDREGNVEPVRQETVRIIEKGSACQADCTAKPSPNRFLKECRNLNGCSYYNYQGDDGQKTANLCDYLSPGAWVRLNATHEVKCPDGPVRKNTYTGTALDIESSQCENVLTVPFLTLLEGKPITMRFIWCADGMNS